MSLQSVSNPSTPEIIIPYGWVAKILRVPVYRMALGTDPVSRILIAVYNFFASLCQGTNRSFRSFDVERAESSVQRFKALGAEVQFVTPRDQKGHIQMMTFKAKQLEEKIIGFGGTWEKEGIQFKIRLPRKPEDELLCTFVEQLGHFHWKKVEGEQEIQFITCDCADEVSEGSEAQCFLYAHSTSGSFVSDWKRAGFYIGAKQDLCFFDNGNTWRNEGRPVSEESFYLEIEAVYDQLRKTEGFSVAHLWVGGSCGGAPVAAYLKKLLHEDGVHFFVEQSFPDLDDFVKPISPFFAPRIKGSLSDPTTPVDVTDPPTACQFGARKMWENLTQNAAGKFILIQVEEDEDISSKSYEDYLNLAQRVNQQVTHLTYCSTTDWHHADNFFLYPKARQQFLHAVFSPG